MAGQVAARAREVLAEADTLSRDGVGTPVPMEVWNVVGALMGTVDNLLQALAEAGGDR